MVRQNLVHMTSVTYLSCAVTDLGLLCILSVSDHDVTSWVKEGLLNMSFLCVLHFSVFGDSWSALTLWQQGLTLCSLICSLSAPAAENTNLWSAGQIVSYHVSISAGKEHLFGVPASPENNVSELWKRVFYTLLGMVAAEIS